MKALIVSPTSDALTPSAAPVAASAGRLMSMPEYGTAASAPSSSVNAKESGSIRMDEYPVMCDEFSRGDGARSCRAPSLFFSCGSGAAAGTPSLARSDRALARHFGLVGHELADDP